MWFSWACFYTVVLLAQFLLFLLVFPLHKGAHLVHALEKNIAQLTQIITMNLQAMAEIRAKYFPFKKTTQLLWVLYELPNWIFFTVSINQNKAAKRISYLLSNSFYLKWSMENRQEKSPSLVIYSYDGRQIYLNFWGRQENFLGNSPSLPVKNWFALLLWVIWSKTNKLWGKIISTAPTLFRTGRSLTYFNINGWLKPSNA